MKSAFTLKWSSNEMNRLIFASPSNLTLDLPEKIFLWVACAFGFVIFSCAFPTGVVSTLSVFLFASSLVCICRNHGLKFRSLWLQEILGLITFGGIAISVLWSDARLLTSLNFLFEYRLFFMIPPVVAVLVRVGNYIDSLLLSMLAGAVVALFASYALWLEVLEIEGASRSLANRVYHGFDMSILAALALFVKMRVAQKRIHFVMYGLIFLSAFNVFFVENGRTGYLQMSALLLLVVVPVQFERRNLLLGFACIFIMVIVAQLSGVLEPAVLRLVATYENALVYFHDPAFYSSAGLRLSFYSAAIDLLQPNWLLGLGVGDVEASLAAHYKAGRMPHFTDNVHSELLNQMLIGGVVQGCLWLVWLLSFLCIFVDKRISQSLRWLTLSLVLIVFIGSLFNSYLKDFGEKHALIIFISFVIAVAKIEKRRKNTG